MIATLPLGMVLLWLAMIASGDGRLDRLGNPVGGDFAMFYIAGNMASQAQWSLLYNEPEQQRRLVELFPGLPLDTYLPYRYPPLLAAMLAPLGSLPYRTAQALWCIASLLIWLVSWFALSRTLRTSSTLAYTCLVGLVASPIMAQTLIDGQASFWWFAILTFTWLAVYYERYPLAGMCLALAACKPNVLLLLGILLVVRHPRMLLGVIPTGLLMLVATLSIAGRECLSAYIELGSQLATQSWSVETPYWKVQSLLSWTQPLLGSAARTVNLGIGIIIAASVGLWWRQADHQTSHVSQKLQNSAVAISVGLLTNALFNPYTPVYDLMLLSLGLFAWLVVAEGAGVLEHWLAKREIKLLLGCFWVGPILSQSLARELACPQQWMPLVMLIAMVVCWVACGFKSVFTPNANPLAARP